MMVSMGLGLLGVDPILEKGHIRFKKKIVFHGFMETKKMSPRLRVRFLLFGS